MRTLSLREKCLIYIAVILALAAGWYYFEKMPADSAGEMAKAELVNLGRVTAQRQEAIEKISWLEEEKARLKQEAFSSDIQYPVYENSNISMMEELTVLFDTSGIQVQSVKVESMEETDQTAGTSLIYTGGREDEEQGWQEDWNQDSSSWKILTARVEVDGTGNMEQLCGLLDAIASKPWICVTEFRTEQDGSIGLTISYSMIRI